MGKLRRFSRGGKGQIAKSVKAQGGLSAWLSLIQI